MFSVFNQQYQLTIILDKNKPYESPSRTVINDFFDNPHKDIIIYTPFPEWYLAELIQSFEIIEAAGGLVFKNHRHLLMMYRRGFWDLPKGKIDLSESSFITAVREIYEECNVNVKNAPHVFFDVTYHVYKNLNKKIVKRTYWYLFFIAQDQPLLPQVSEDIEKVEWIDNKQWQLIKKEAYPLIAQLVEKTSLFSYAL